MSMMMVMIRISYVVLRKPCAELPIDLLRKLPCVIHMGRLCSFNSSLVPKGKIRACDSAENFSDEVEECFKVNLLSLQNTHLLLLNSTFAALHFFVTHLLIRH